MKQIALVIVLAINLPQNLRGQSEVTCGYPINVSADSLVEFVKNDFLERTGRAIQVSEEDWRTYFYNNQLANLDSAYSISQQYLINLLGEYVYCNYIDMFLNSFGINHYNNKEFFLSFGFQLPNLVNKQRYGYIDCEFERVVFSFKFKLQPDNSIIIEYPQNVPNCRNLPDCGFKITREKAIEIARKKKFIKQGDTYNLTPDGINWILSVSQGDDITYEYAISIQTGRIMDKKKWVRR